MASAPFSDHRLAALALLNGTCRLTRKEGGFLGNLVVDPTPLSVRQADWLDKLLVRSSLPPMTKP